MNTSVNHKNREIVSGEMQQSSPPNIVATVGCHALASSEDLKRQSDFFAEAFMTRHLLDVMPGMVLVLNQYRQIVFANRAFLQIAGRSMAESLVGRFVGDVLLCHVALDAVSGCGTGDSCETCGALMAMMSGFAGQENVQECTLTRQAGVALQSLTLRVWSAPLNYCGESFIILAGMDISHERRRLALERTFFHDILNLVGSIRGFAELIEIDKNAEPLQISRRIQRASQRIIDEIDAQRVLLAVEKGELKVDSHMLVSREVLLDIIDLYEGQDVARKRLLKIDAVSKVFPFISDVTLLRRILGNMVKNALEASTEGEVVSIGAESDGTECNFWVHNQAVIPSSYQQRIFQRDFSTKGAGRGLGTYSMKILGYLLAGEVSFVSNSNLGTRFSLCIPILYPEKLMLEPIIMDEDNCEN
jgi:signal transduction histidine kinase